MQVFEKNRYQQRRSIIAPWETSSEGFCKLTGTLYSLGEDCCQLRFSRCFSCGIRFLIPGHQCARVYHKSSSPQRAFRLLNLFTNTQEIFCSRYPPPTTRVFFFLRRKKANVLLHRCFPDGKEWGKWSTARNVGPIKRNADVLLDVPMVIYGRRRRMSREHESHCPRRTWGGGASAAAAGLHVSLVSHRPNNCLYIPVSLCEIVCRRWSRPRWPCLFDNAFT
jgi:hypothetical protein